MRALVRRIGPWVLVVLMVVLMVVAEDRGWSLWTAGLPLAVVGIVVAATMRGDELASWRGSWRTRTTKFAWVAIAGTAVGAIVTSALQTDPVAAAYGAMMLIALLLLAMRGTSTGAAARNHEPPATTT